MKSKTFGEAVVTMGKALRYSFAFCWRNGRRETVGYALATIVKTIVSYLLVQAIGLVINTVQRMSAEPNSVGLSGPLLFMALTLFFSKVFGQFDWYYRGRWRQVLNYAGQRESDSHRATLDVGRCRSKEFDDLRERIEDLPAGWSTRFEFSDEMSRLLMMLLSFILFGASLLWYQPVYALVLLVVTLPIMIVKLRLATRWWNLSQELVPTYKERGVLKRAFRGNTTFVQALMFKQLPVLTREIETSTSFLLGRYDKLRRDSVRNQSLAGLVMVTGLCAIVVHAVLSVVNHKVEIGTFTIILTAANAFQGNLESIVSTLADQWNSAKGVILIEEEFFSLKPSLKTENPIRPTFVGPPAIRFDNVCFAYPGTDSLVLKNVSFTVEPGEKVAIVGKSGNGKSTIQALLTRHYDPTSGVVTADGIDLRRIKPEDWYEQVSALTQSFEILDRTIGREIASSRLDREIDPESLYLASNFACFSEVVNSDPKGFDSQIGTEFGGREFSGGEAQRLAMARVRYRQTPVLILDEPDANLDPESAQRVMDNIFALRGVTVIMITHHVSRAERCDKVIVMGKGEVVEQGNHAELITQNGVYASAYKKDQQRLGQE